MTEINSGPYNYKMIFEGKGYPHSINITKLVFNYKLNNNDYSKIIFISTGHSFAEQSYQTDLNITINKTNNINDIFDNRNQNIFYSIDNGFDDIALICFGSIKINNTNTLTFNYKKYQIKSICTNTDIKFLENEILIKNGCSTGDIFTIPIINFDTDKYLTTQKKNFNYFTFKINGKIIILSSKFPSGIIVKGQHSKLSKFNGEILNEEKSNELFEYYFFNIIKDFMSHELFQNIKLDVNIKKYYKKYMETNCLSLVSLMGDSGSGFYRMVNDEYLEFVGINIGGCSMVVLSPSQDYTQNQESINNFKLDESLNKLIFGKYIIEEVHKCCQILSIDKIQELIKKNISNNIQLTNINV